MALLALSSYIRAGYKNRRTYDRVTISKAGVIEGHWDARLGRPALAPTNLGHIDDCRTSQTDTGVRLYNRDFLVYTFALPGATA